MTKILSLKLRDEVFQVTEEITKKNKISRNKYINQALDFYNQLQKRKILKNQLAKESELVSQNSLEILAEFELLTDDLV